MKIRLAPAAIPLLLFSPDLSANAEKPLEGRVIVVDAGHGVVNVEGGVINGGKHTRDNIPEHRLTLQIGEKLEEKLTLLGATIYKTRSPDHYWRHAYNSVDDNKSRGVLADQIGADALISVHCDWHPNHRIYGVTTLYEKSVSKKLGEMVLASMTRTLRARSRGNKKDTFTILSNTSVPAVIVETGFMSHRSESKKLTEPDYQEKIADGIAKGLVRYFAAKTGP